MRINPYPRAIDHHHSNFAYSRAHACALTIPYAASCEHAPRLRSAAQRRGGVAARWAKIAHVSDTDHTKIMTGLHGRDDFM
jgi:hypothetical protein